MGLTKTKDRTPAGNITYPKGGVSCSKDSFEVTGTFVLLINIFGGSPALLLAANRQTPASGTSSAKTVNKLV
jgi:hypothetical protein